MKSIAAIIIAISLSSCSLTVAPDGTRLWVFDSEVARAVIVHATK
jgi:hypothetical protein